MTRGIHQVLSLNEDRFFDSDPSIRAAARALYDETRDLPLVCPHGHVDASLLAADDAFPEPATLLITPDHYIFRMLYAQGVSMESLGIPTRDGTPYERRRASQDPAAPSPTTTISSAARRRERGSTTSCTIYSAFASSSTAAQPDSPTTRSSESAGVARVSSARIVRSLQYRSAGDDGQKPARASPIMRRFAILAWGGRVVPTFRPDGVFRIAA